MVDTLVGECNANGKIIDCSSFPAENLINTFRQDNFNLLSINIHSLHAHYDDLNNFLSDIPLGFFDIIALQEVWSVRAGFPLPGYQKLVFQSRDMNTMVNSNCGGGIGLYVRNGYNFEVMHELSTFVKGVYESLWICISLPRNKKLLICSIYRPNSLPLASEQKAISLHFNTLDKIKADKTLCKAKQYLCSDFNIDLLTCGHNANSASYLNGHFDRGFLPTILSSAHITSTSSKIIDHIFVKSPIIGSKSGVIETLISDHMPTCFSDPSVKHNIPEEGSARPLINKTTTASYLDLLSKVNFSGSNDPAIAFNSFFDQLEAVGSLAFPITIPKPNKSKSRHNNLMSSGYSLLAKQKYSALNQD